jgi:hypothetical protein
LKSIAELVKDAEAFWEIGAAGLPMRITGAFFCVNSLNDGKGDDDMLHVWNAFGGEDERIKMSWEAILSPKGQPLRRAQFEKRERHDSVDIVAHILVIRRGYRLQRSVLATVVDA